MRSLLKLLAFAAVFAIGAASSMNALAAEKQQILQDRQDLMIDQGRQWLVIRNYLQDKADQAAASAAVGSLAKTVPTVPNYFPPGTEGPNPDGKYAPKPEVWSEGDKFLAADKKVVDQVAALDAAIRSGDKTKVEVAFKELAVCSACHDTFRAKLQ
ncbi:MAG TPA: cytochrome c [Stellaceae bacterium]|nr:cytochrome c [Stellaceae bacterium]